MMKLSVYTREMRRIEGEKGKRVDERQGKIIKIKFLTRIPTGC